mgnify:FL=1|jgi:hypothetical protein
MASALGIFIDRNIIKYAKLNGTKDKLKVESYGMKYGENHKELLKQIIEETNSSKNNVVINAAEIHYEETSIFSMLKKKDYDKAVEVAYEEIIDKQKLRPELLEYGYILSKNPADSEKLHVLLGIQEKGAMETRANLFGQNVMLYSQMPIGISISNIYESPLPALIVNIEEDTYITEIYDTEPIKVTRIATGTKNIIDTINNEENSISKSYEVLRNMVLPTDDMDQISFEGNEYAPVIVSEVMKIVSEIKSVMKKRPGIYKKIYISGTGATISNLETFIEKLIDDVECDILRPAGIEGQKKVAIKEYVDVNSAIALACEALRI